MNALSKKISELEEEFKGKPEKCLEMAVCIVHIRRKINLEKNLFKFNELLTDQHVIKNMDTRWLVSMCDTIIDHGSHEDASKAAIITTYINLLKLSGTYLILCDHKLNESHINNDFSRNKPIYDGVIAFTLKNEDALINLHRRLQKIMNNNDSGLKYVWSEILKRIRSSENPITMFERLQKPKKLTF
jgi:hypothetical protein